MFKFIIHIFIFGFFFSGNVMGETESIYKLFTLEDKIGSEYTDSLSFSFFFDRVDHSLMYYHEDVKAIINKSKSFTIMVSDSFPAYNINGFIYSLNENDTLDLYYWGGAIQYCRFSGPFNIGSAFTSNYNCIVDDFLSVKDGLFFCEEYITNIMSSAEGVTSFIYVKNKTNDAIIFFNITENIPSSQEQDNLLCKKLLDGFSELRGKWCISVGNDEMIGKKSKRMRLEEPVQRQKKNNVKKGVSGRVSP